MPLSSKLAVEYVPIGELKLDAFNPRRISKEQLERLTESIRHFGFVDPVVARRQDCIVIGGHQRLLAASRLGMREVPVVFVEVTGDEARLLNLALNRISGEWDEELLACLLRHLDEVSLDLALSGFEEGEITALLRSLDGREKRTRPECFDLQAALEAAEANLGEPADVWLLGPHRLLCGDATRAEDVRRLIEGQEAQMAFTDPPYNVAYGSSKGQGHRRAIANDALPAAAWEEFVRRWSRNLLASVAGPLYICMSCKEWPTVSRVLEELGAHWSTTIIWAKDRFVIGRSDYQRQYEPLWYGWRQGAPHRWQGGRDQGDVWNIARPADSDLHPTMKPLELVERALENSSRPGDTVFDPFLGSGTTLIAAERTGRSCLAIEIDPRYCRVAVARWEAFTGEKAERVRN